jgi:hypothetical protein
MALADYAANSPESSLAKPIISVSPWVILGVLMAGEYVILLDTTIVNVAIPSLTSSLLPGTLCRTSVNPYQVSHSINLSFIASTQQDKLE